MRRKYLRKLTGLRPSITECTQYGKWKKDVDAMYIRSECGLKTS